MALYSAVPQNMLRSKGDISFSTAWLFATFLVASWANGSYTSLYHRQTTSAFGMALIVSVSVLIIWRVLLDRFFVLIWGPDYSNSFATEMTDAGRIVLNFFLPILVCGALLLFLSYRRFLHLEIGEETRAGLGARFGNLGTASRLVGFDIRSPKSRSIQLVLKDLCVLQGAILYALVVTVIWFALYWLTGDIKVLQGRQEELWAMSDFIRSFFIWPSLALLVPILIGSELFAR